MSLSHTSLGAALGWLLAAEFLWSFSSACSALFDTSSGLMMQLWYWTAIVSLCPMISVLGSRRPTSRVWSWFVVVPLLAVLGWPAITVWFSRLDRLPPLEIQAPALGGLLLALTMGAGNYAGTRLGGTALGASLAILLAVVPNSSTLGRLVSPDLFWGAASGLMAASIGAGLHICRRSPKIGDPYDLIWHDFRDTFGLVWSIRIQESLNAGAEQRQCHWRIGPLGVDWRVSDPSRPEPDVVKSFENSLRWHLRRFVDPDWIDQRLGPPTDSDGRS
ncbi:MAG: hypothetical protein KDA80_06535 [Planctomycetaceae bacterium]|nr:hypothetical protein [Planctomycetaceae bacterium]